MIGALIQLLCLWMNLRARETISRAGVLSAAQWEEFAAQVHLRCALSGLCAAAFLGSFLIGTLAKSRRAARLGEAALLLLLGLGSACFILLPASSAGAMVLGGVLVLLCLAAGVYFFYKRNAHSVS